jgi:hypothetical protein
MKKIEEAQEILNALGLPARQQNEMAALVLLALCGVTPATPWDRAERRTMTVTKGIMAFIQENYGRSYAANTREPIRRQVLHQFMQWGAVDYNADQPDRKTNSPKASYILTEAALDVVRSFGTQDWESRVELFRNQQEGLITILRRKRDAHLMPVKLPDGMTRHLSPGAHSKVQVAVLEEFAPRFAPEAHLLYLGDTAKRSLFLDRARLSALGITITEHDKLPDVMFYDENRKWLYLIEVVTSHGPISNTRLLQLEQMLAGYQLGKVYVTAFPDFKTFRKHSQDIAWETEIWIAEIPDHLIHYNGDRFLGPR